ncbi:hypothetical protein MHTCC0001_26450 [Flavobacteriaceae bacterium MHTCC 0001]
MIFTPQFIIFFTLIFILTWLFATTIDKRKWVRFLISLAATPIIYFYVFYPFINIFFSFHHQKHFNAEAWKDKPALRYEMSDAMIKQQMLFGKRKDEVALLLGSSEWYSWDDAIKANSPEMWNYNLGFKPGAFNMMQECLEVVFEDNKVKMVKQYQMEKEFE